LNAAISSAGKLFLSALIYPRFVAPYRWQLTRYEMPLVNLPPAFNGYRILQLTDLHVGKTRIDYLTQVFDKTMREKPDLVVITGDLIDYHPSALPLLKQLLTFLKNHAHQPPGGILAIFGNHDYHEYSWRHVGPRSAGRAIHKRLVHMVREVGITLLRNEQHFVTARAPEGTEGRLVIVGLDEMWTGRADAAAAFAGLGVSDAVVCLQHNPDGVEFLKNYPWQWMLCGHSHGGQALFPGLGALYVPMEHRHYLQGFFHFPLLPGMPASLEHRTMFVSRGLGHSTPIRLRCPPEATMFTLRAV
jgi:predicted MPP superfamily phosphohydrolase